MRLIDCFVGDRVKRGDGAEGMVRRFYDEAGERSVTWCELVTADGSLLRFGAFDEGWEKQADDAPLPADPEPAPEPEPEQVKLPIHRLWPDFEGHPVTEIDLALGGSAQLHGGVGLGDNLAPRLHGNAMVVLVGTYRVEGVGHRVERDRTTGAAVGRVGVAKLKLRSLTDPDGLARALHDSYAHQAEAIVALEEVLEQYPDPEDPLVEANPVRDAFVHVRRTLLLGSERASEIAEQERRKRESARAQGRLA
ncbi:MAG: hypothetical protein ACKVVT_01830 [Dehalococcoidia bacterium]